MPPGADGGDSQLPPPPGGGVKDKDDGGMIRHPGHGKNDVDNWLPVTGSRNAKWWYSTFHNVTAMVGAGVLSLPGAMAYLGWTAGTIVLVLSWVITLYTLWQMVEMHEMVPGKRFDRYHELGQEAFGPKLGLWIVVPQQIIVEVGVDIVYMVTGGLSLYKFYRLVKCPDYASTTQSCHHIGQTAFICIFASQHFFLAQLPNFNSISLVSLCAAVMSLSYSTIAWVDTVALGRKVNDYNLPYSKEKSNTIFQIMNALGNVAFAYAGHNVVLEIQATLPSSPQKPSKHAMWRGVVFAYIVVALCYFPVAILGYWAYGNSIGNSNILLFLGKPRWVIALANLMVVVHVTGSYQLYAMPVFDMLETLLIKRLRMKPSITLRLVTRSLYVLFTAFVACTLPFFGDLLGFLGGFAFAPTTYFLPCIIWLCIRKPRVGSLSWITNWICIFLGSLLAIVASIGGLRNIIKSASTYKFYQ